jgi:hypothetical protein
MNYNDSDSPTASLQGAATYVIDFINGAVDTWNPSRNFTLRYSGIWAASEGERRVFEFSAVAATLAERVEEALGLIATLKTTGTRVTVVPGAAGEDFDTVEVTITGPYAGGLIEIFNVNELADRYVSITTDVDDIAILEPAWSYPTYVFHEGVYYECILPHSPVTTGLGPPPVVTTEPPDATYWTPLSVKPETFDWQYPETILTGTVTVPALSAFVVGTGTLFTEELSVGDWVNIAGEPVEVETITDDTNLKLVLAHTDGATDVPISIGGNIWTRHAVQYSPGGRGFPTIGVIHQQRMVLMAQTAFPTAVFGSRIGQYRDFTLGPQDDDPFFFALDTSDNPVIKWATAQRKLLLGTSSGDYALQAQIVLTPSDVQAVKQNAARSHGASPVTINTDVFYIEQGKSKLRSTGYSDDLNSQTSKDISLIAEHLLNSRCKRLALMQTPEVLVFGLREDGSLVVISYSHELGTGAWFEFESEGKIIDMTTAYSTTTDEDELWAIITYDDGVTRFLQKMPYPKRVFTVAEYPADPHLVDQGLVCLDGWLTGTIATGDNNIITGLDQYEQLRVTATVDDAYAGEYVVVDGAIVLDEPPDDDVPNYSGTWAVGLGYQGLAETFEEVRGNPKGSGLGTKRRWNWLRLKTLNSALPKINGQLPEDRTPSTVMGTAEIIRPGLDDVGVTNLGWADGSITILQDRPYPTQILGFYGEFGVGSA